jgi:hypothetical protein
MYVINNELDHFKAQIFTNCLDVFVKKFGVGSGKIIQIRIQNMPLCCFRPLTELAVERIMMLFSAGMFY